MEVKQRIKERNEVVNLKNNDKTFSPVKNVTRPRKTLSTMTDKQFDNAFTSAGGWFILTQFETVYEWRGEKRDLVDQLYLEGFDKARTGTSTRVSSLMRIIDNGSGKEALEKIRDSAHINRTHPEAFSMANRLIKKHYA